MALEFDEWIQYAEKNNLLITDKDLKKLQIARPYKVIQVDYIRFLAIEYGDQYNIELNRIYDPIALYQRFTELLIPTGEWSMTQAPVIQKNCCLAKWESVENYGAILLPSNSNKSYEIGLHKIKTDPWIMSGSGDGYSRWMLWSNLSKMPQVYIEYPNE